MSFDDRYTLDDLYRAATFREPVMLTPEKIDDLLEEMDASDERAEVKLAQRIAPTFRAMPLKWRKAIADALGTNTEDLVA